MCKLKSYLNNIPEGRLRKLIGNDVCDSITAYNKLENVDKPPDYAEILLNRFGPKILINTKNDVLKFVFLFLKNEYLKKIGEVIDEDYHDLEDLRQILLRKRFGNNNKEYSVKLLKALDLDPEYYLYEETEEKITLNKKCTPQYDLHNFQKQVKDISIANLLDIEESDKQLIHMPTGSGKTKTTIEIICDYLRNCSILGGHYSTATVIWLAHNNELCYQAAEAFLNTWNLRGDVEVNIEPLFGPYGYRDINFNSRYNVCISSLPKFTSLVKSNKSFQKQLRTKFKNNVDLVVVDEAHKSLATTWKKTIKFLADAPNCQLIGLTATPGRSASLDDSQNVHLAQFFRSKKIGLVDKKGKKIKNPLKYLQQKGFLAYLDKEEILTDIEISLSQKEYNNIRDYGDKKIKNILKDLTKNPKRNKKLVDKIIEEYKKDRKILVFTCSVAHNFVVQTILQNRDIRSECIVGGTPKEQRKKYINEFRKGDLNILLNYGVLSTGFDAPELNTLIIARPTTSIVLYSQMIGRALRGPLNKGNKRNKLITLKDNINIGGEHKIFGHFDEIWDNF